MYTDITQAVVTHTHTLLRLINRARRNAGTSE